MSFYKTYDFKSGNLRRYDKTILLLLWFIVQGFLLWHYGVVTYLEADKYISQAEYFIQHGTLSTNNYWLYSTEVFLIVAAIKLHLGFTVIAIVQLLLNLFSTWMFYKLALSFLKRELLAFIVTIIFIINIPYQVYNSFLFTESIFYSLTVIYSSYLLRLQKLTIKSVITLLFLLLLMIITRPTGILFFGATALYIPFMFFNNISLWYKLLIIGFTVTVFIGTLNIIMNAGGSLDFMLPFKKENIICGVNTNNNVEINTIEKGNSIEGIVYYIANNKDQFFKLAKLKTISFFGLIRNYYSAFHNAYLVIFFYPLYLLSFIGLWKMLKRKNRKIIYLLTIILLYWITTLLTCDDWHNRFVLTVSPFIFLIAFAAFTSKHDALKNEIS
jgi:hypothetical protein